MSEDNPFLCKHCGSELYVTMVMGREGLSAMVFCKNCDQLENQTGEAMTPDEPVDE